MLRLGPRPSFPTPAPATSSWSSTSDDTELQQVGNEFVSDATGDSYNPALPEFGGTYILQMHNGTQLTINATTGDLSSINDLNGNTLTFTGTGIQSSSGPSVSSITTPPADISSITSSSGQTVSYQYDDSGNLIAFTDADGNTTQFTYLSDPAPLPEPDHRSRTAMQAAAVDYTTRAAASSPSANADGQHGPHAPMT